MAMHNKSKLGQKWGWNSLNWPKKNETFNFVKYIVWFYIYKLEENLCSFYLTDVEAGVAEPDTKKPLLTGKQSNVNVSNGKNIFFNFLNSKP